MSISGGICVVAGEASGDAQIAPVLESLVAEFAAMGAPQIAVWGAAGPRMRAMGVEPVVRTEDLAVMAYAEILPAYFRVRQAYENLLSEIENRKPIAVILVDYPGFNLKLARDLHMRGHTVLYHIPPKVWAHSWERVHNLAAHSHLVTCILPFEEAMLRGAGVNARFVGNPLVDAIRDFRKAKPFKSEAESRCFEIAVLPGSRKSELRSLVPLYLQALFELEKKLAKPLKGRVPVAQTLTVQFVESLFQKAAKDLGISEEWLRSRLSLEQNGTYDILNDADYCWVCSGTAALEVGIFGVPNAVAYRMSLVSALIAKAKIRVPYVSLGNLCLQRRIVPEFLQYEATVDNLVTHAHKMLTDEGARRAMEESLSQLACLFPGGASKRAAKLMAQVILENLVPDPEKFRKHETLKTRILAGELP
jgi:lipid-A-disaccharide synthase